MATGKRSGRVVKHKLADGTTKVYRYPPHRRARSGPKPNTLNEMIRAYRRSPDYCDLKESSRRIYDLYLRPLEANGHATLDTLTRKGLNTMRDVIAVRRGKGAAAMFVAVVSKLCSWAVEESWLIHNPAFRLKQPKLGTIATWTPEEADRAERVLPEHWRRAIILARYTAQRRSDLCRITWSAYDGQSIRVTQLKTGTPLVIPCHPRLKAELDEWAKTRTATTIITGARGLPVSSDGFGKELHAALREAGFAPHLTVHGLRKMAATELAEAGCTAHEIMAITGHKTLAMVQHYTAAVSQERLASAAIVRLSHPTKATNGEKMKSGTKRLKSDLLQDLAKLASAQEAPCSPSTRQAVA